MSRLAELHEKLRKCQQDLHLARVLIRELKESKKDMRALYQKQTEDYQSKIRELIKDAHD